MQVKNETVSRKDELIDAAKRNAAIISEFIRGAEWADRNPRKGLWDAEKVISFIKENVREYHKSGVFHVDGFIKGYDQAMKDIEEFFYDRFNIHPHDCHVIQYDSDTPLESMDDFIKQIENYIKDEQ